MSLKNRIVLVTGGAGFIGSNLVDTLLARDIEKVIIFDNFSTGFDYNIAHLKNNDRVEVIHGDILNFESLDNQVARSDLIFHHAAQLEIIKATENPMEDLRVNTLGTLNVLLSAVKHNIKKIVYASSGGVYGQAKYIPVDEKHPTRPQWSYGVSKLAGEQYCIQFYELYGLPITSLRYSIVYGEREWYGRVLTIFVKNALENKPLSIFGDGKQTRDFVNVQDVIDANLLAATKKSADGEIFNIASGVGFTVEELCKLVVDYAKKPTLKILREDPKPGEKGRKLGELREFILSIEKAKRILAYSPKIDFKKQGLPNYIKWVSQNKDKYWTYPMRV